MTETESTAANESNVQRAPFDLPTIHKGQKLGVAMLLYPGVTLLNLLGPQTPLAPSCNTYLIWKNIDLLETDSGVVMKATSTFDDCPKELDVLFVPGGAFGVMENDEVLRFLADRRPRPRYVKPTLPRAAKNMADYRPLA